MLCLTWQALLVPVVVEVPLAGALLGFHPLGPPAPGVAADGTRRARALPVQQARPPQHGGGLSRWRGGGGGGRGNLKSFQGEKPAIVLAIVEGSITLVACFPHLRTLSLTISRSRLIKIFVVK